MDKTERIIIGLFVCVTCPLLSFVFFWWTSAVISMHVENVPTGAIIVTAFTGLGIGLLLNIFFLKRWVARFYTANAFLMVTIYLGLSIIGLAFFMGLPVGTFGVGVLAGAHVGRKRCHLHPGSDMISQSLTRVSLLGASVTTALALPIGFMVFANRSRDGLRCILD